MDKFDLITSIIFTLFFALLGIVGVVGAIVIKMFYPAVLGAMLLLSAWIMYRGLRQDLIKNKNK